MPFPPQSSPISQMYLPPPDAFQEIPSLSLTHPPEAHKDRALVRFRAMIQDTSVSPEMYLARLSHARCGGWGLGEEGDQSIESINYADLRDCIVLWAVNVPGESSWCSNALDAPPVPQNHATHRPPHPHKFPVPDAPHIGIQIKIYGNGRAIESFKATELHTFVGILTSEPFVPSIFTWCNRSRVPSGYMPTWKLLLQSWFLPSTVLFFQPVPTTIIPRVYPLDLPAPNDLRDELITWIADSSLAGDREAAEWVLLCAIARVQSRTPPILPLTLTMSRFPSPMTKPDAKTIPVLSYILSLICPVLTTIPLSLDTLNDTSFAPESKNEDLHSGWLQLPSGSLCLVTEGGITEGKVSERGLANLRAMQEMMDTQTLEYAFPYSQFTFNTDVAFIILSGGKKSAMFQTSVNVPLTPADLTADFDFYKDADAITLPSQETLGLFRSLIGCAKVGNVAVSEETAEFIQEDFVKERKAAAAPSDALSSEDLIHMMMLARLVALSLQETEITVPIWGRVKALEAKRKARISE
ncbi:mini-chromosome maintenance replisome factor-domain-containing protein [Lyophyllum atratum]|nr:mini-chromosome maintenance replisome factor-domain-containing protein [Lyophyllum atratum]